MKIPGNSVIRWPTHFCEFYHQELNWVLTVKIRGGKKNLFGLLLEREKKGTILKYIPDPSVFLKKVCPHCVYYPNLVPVGEGKPHHQPALATLYHEGD